MSGIMQRTLCAATVALLPLGLPVAQASAGGGSPFPPAPPIDVSGLPQGAVVRPESTEARRHPVEVRLLTEHAQVSPGSTISLGVHLVQDEAWHTYWKSPGDIGLPTVIQWTLPEGSVAHERTWPVPERFEQDGIVSFGYDREVLHITEVTLPEGLAAGPHTVEADVEWLVCKTSCIPGSAHVKTTIHVGDTATPGPHAPLFDAYRQRWPADSDLVDVTVTPCSTPVVPNSPFHTVFTVRAAEGHTLGDVGEALWPTFVPTSGLDWMVDSATLRREGDTLLVTVAATSFEPDPLPTGDRIGGLFQVPVDGGWVRTEVSNPIPWAATGTDVVRSDAAVCAGVGDGAADAPEEGPAEIADVELGEVYPPPDAFGNASGVAAWSVTMLLTNFLLAFVGGLILNVMPCVLPVLTLKLYGLVEQGGISDREKKQAGVLYTLGILSSFWVLALGVWGVRNVLGESVGWGYQMQYPGYVAGLATLVFLFGLSLFGVFEIPAFGTGSAHELSGKEGPSGYFFTGVFATLVATPCSAPFLGTATAFAFQAPTYMLVLVFTFVGLGLAFPFLIVAMVPAAYKLLPKPGEWMETFKQFLGFTLVATTLWLVSVLFGLLGTDGGMGFLAFLTTVSLGAWIFGRWGGVAMEGSKQLKALAVGVGVAMLGGWQFLSLELAPPEACAEGAVDVDGLSFVDEIPWQAFSPQRVADLQGQILFIDFTADWCVSCKVNEATVLETATVRDAMAKHGVVPLEADFTRKDPVIGEWLTQFERAGVPMYLVVPRRGLEGAVLLPEVITPGMVVEALEAAAAETVGQR